MRGDKKTLGQRHMVQCHNVLLQRMKRLDLIMYWFEAPFGYALDGYWGEKLDSTIRTYN